jgi:hypothetical protein
MEEENIAWGLRIEREERERRKVNRMMRIAAGGADEASTEPGRKGEEDEKELTVAEKQKMVVDAIRFGIEKYFAPPLALHASEKQLLILLRLIATTSQTSFHVTTFVRIDKALFNFPSPGALAGVIDHWDLTSPASGTSHASRTPARTGR